MPPPRKAGAKAGAKTVRWRDTTGAPLVDLLYIEPVGQRRKVPSRSNGPPPPYASQLKSFEKRLARHTQRAVFSNAVAAAGDAQVRRLRPGTMRDAMQQAADLERRVGQHHAREAAAVLRDMQLLELMGVLPRGVSKHYGQ